MLNKFSGMSDGFRQMSATVAVAANVECEGIVECRRVDPRPCQSDGKFDDRKGLASAPRLGGPWGSRGAFPGS